MKSAELGYADAQATVAAFFEAGLVVNQNMEEAKKWYERAAAGGSQMARDALSNW